MDQPYRRITVRGLAVLDGRVLAVQHATADGSPAPPTGRYLVAG